MDKSFRYFEPIVQLSGRAQPNVAKWDQACKLHTEGQFANALTSLMQYYRPDLTSLTEGQEVELKHGSLSLRLRWEKGQVFLKAPFLNLGEEVSAALMRKIAEMNMNELTMSQVRLEGDLLFYEYSSPIELTHPAKMADLFREICMSGDYYDDLFVEKFKAKHIQDSPSKPLSPEKVKASYEAMQVILRQSHEAVDHFLGKRQVHFAMDSAMIALYQLVSTIEPQGYVNSLLGQIINGMFAYADPNQLLADYKKNTQKLLEFSEEKLGESLYEADFFLPLLRACNFTEFQNFMRGYLHQADHERKNNEFVGSTLSMVRGIQDLLYRYDVPSHIRTPLNQLLLAASDRPWNQASDILHAGLTPLMNEQLAVAESLAEKIGRAS